MLPKIFHPFIRQAENNLLELLILSVNIKAVFYIADSESNFQLLFLISRDKLKYNFSHLNFTTWKSPKDSVHRYCPFPRKLVHQVHVSAIKAGWTMSKSTAVSVKLI